MYIVEGNIGAGKTTFLKLIQERLPEIAVVFEPLHSWHSQVYGQSILSKFYDDPHRWAYTMETLAMACRVREHLAEQENPNHFRLLERSIYSGHYVFATNDYHKGFLSELEWQVYLQWFDFLVTGKCTPPQGFVYLRTKPEIAYGRIKKRDRSGESTISFEYIQQIHECHEDFLVNKKGVAADLINVPVLILECNKEFEADPVQFAAHAEKLSSFVQLQKQKSAKVSSFQL
jgi:thymidine kinase